MPYFLVIRKHFREKHHEVALMESTSKSDLIRQLDRDAVHAESGATVYTYRVGDLDEFLPLPGRNY